MVSTNFYESLNELVTDSRFRNISVSYNFENYFNEYGINECENMHTFSWFLNPNGSHGLKDVFYKELLTNVWGMIHGEYRTDSKKLQQSNFFKNVTPLYVQKSSFCNAFIDRDVKQQYPGCDFVISDANSKTLVIINNKYNKTECEKAYTYFNSQEYSYFENKIFISFDGQTQTQTEAKWMYLNNEWLINLCSQLIEGRQFTGAAVIGQLCDFYQFLTGTRYVGTQETHIAEYSASLISNFYSTLNDLRNFKAEKVPTKSLVSINPREYATTYQGNISEKEYEVLSLYWSYRNTFNTFFQLVELEGVTKDLDKNIERKAYCFERTFIRNGLCYTPGFDVVPADRGYMNKIFDVAVVQDMNKNLSMSLVVNKQYWDKLSGVQREVIQKNFDFNGLILKDKIAIYNKYYGTDWKNKDLSKEVISLFEKVEGYLGKISIKVA